MLRFKVPQVLRRDGSLSEGPRIVDAKKQPWSGAAIGNGSKLIVAFDIYDWDGENGCGMTFQPRAIQVVDYIPYEQLDPTEGFAEVEGYSTPPADAADNQTPRKPTPAWSAASASNDQEVPF